MNIRAEDGRRLESAGAIESPISAVSWTAIWAGAAVAAAVSLLLVILGSGLGFASMSPWRSEGPSATTFTVMTAIWLVVVQWIASGVGGYLTGRMRTKWTGVHTHEVTFRDTAHGFATWAVATLITAAIVASATLSAASSGAKAAASATSSIAEIGAAAASGAQPAGGYEIDALFRSTSNTTANSETRAEALRILAKGIKDGDLASGDREYLSELIANRTGISAADADRRVSTAVAQLKAAEVKVREVADAARKAASAAALCTALSMVIGAFIASVAAALGGRERDSHP
jgi:hypothetical protein